MNEKTKIRISDDKERQAIEELSRDLKSNKFVKGLRMLLTAIIF